MKSKPVHYQSGTAAYPVCDGTGRTRRFKGTGDASLVTCARCQKHLAQKLATVAQSVRIDVLGVA
jgi:hypothetical protein